MTTLQAPVQGQLPLEAMAASQRLLRPSAAISVVLAALLVGVECRADTGTTCPSSSPIAMPAGFADNHHFHYWTGSYDAHQCFSLLTVRILRVDAVSAADLPLAQQARGDCCHLCRRRERSPELPPPPCAQEPSEKGSQANTRVRPVSPTLSREFARTRRRCHPLPFKQVGCRLMRRRTRNTRLYSFSCSASKSYQCHLTFATRRPKFRTAGRLKV